MVTEDKVEVKEQPAETPPLPPRQPQPVAVAEPQETAVTTVEKEEESEPQPMALVTQPVPTLAPLGVPEYENGMLRQASGSSLTHDLSSLDETLKDLESFQASLQLDEGVVDEPGGEGGGVKGGGGLKRIMSEGGEEEDEDEDSSDEEG